jgi:hypothetical protein
MYRYPNLPTFDAEDTGIQDIARQLQEYNNLWNKVRREPMGAYSPTFLLSKVEEWFTYMEGATPLIRQWATDYLERNRAAIWLRYGLYKTETLSDSELAITWPFLYGCDRLEYKGFVLDREEAKREKQRQDLRRYTFNPRTNHTCKGCEFYYCTFCDEGNWRMEDCEEREASKNVCFHTELLSAFYDAVLPDRDQFRAQWESWEPPKQVPPRNTYFSTPFTLSGKTSIQAIKEWLESDNFSYKLTHLLHIGNAFDNVWDIMNDMEDMLKEQRASFADVKQYWTE